jgi:hypothetical protein
LEATFDPLNGRWLLVLAAVRRALATRQLIRASRRIATDRALWTLIGTAMLSYAKHGKFPALTQAAQAKSQREKRPFRPNDLTVAPVPHLQWIMGRNGLQIRRVRCSGAEDNWSERRCPNPCHVVLHLLEKRRRTVPRPIRLAGAKARGPR